MRKAPRFLAQEEPLEEPHINLTPLIDIVFVVLIAFMILAPMVDLERIQLAPIGTSKTGKDFANSSLQISVLPNNTIRFQNQAVSLSQLGALLQEAKRRSPLEIPKLIQDERAQFGTYQAIKNTVEACGFEEMDVILKPR